MWLVRLVICSLGLVLALAQEEVTVDIPQGTLKGLKTTTVYHGMSMYSFKGIPYAKPNIGLNKFQVSQPADKWSGVLDATKHRSHCVFFCMVRQKVVGDDDCLFVNIYTPDISKNAGKPVMVFFHPGGFNGGSGDADLFGPDFLIEKDVILVTMNFRLGAAGFLSTADANAPGNNGLKDQVLALKWVRENIVNFGGCPNRITLFGQSSGAASVMYHMISPMSTGLFKRAIIQSGSVLNPWAISYDPKAEAEKLADKLGVKATSTKDLVEKLAAMSTKDLVAASQELSHQKNILASEMHLFTPVVEPDAGQEVFLPAEPWEIVRTGKIYDIPVIIGTNSQESGLFVDMVLPMAPQFEDKFEMFIPKSLNMTDEAMRKNAGDMIKQFYFGGKKVDASTKMELTNLLTDVMFFSGTSISAKIINSRITSPVYEYFFNFNAPFGMMKAFFKLEDGILHGDEMTYEFYSTAFNNKPAPGSRVEKLTNEFVEMWTNFAKEGNPTETMDKIKWEPMGDDGNKYLEINDDLTMKTSLLPERVNFWAKMYMNVLGDCCAKLFS